MRFPSFSASYVGCGSGRSCAGISAGQRGEEARPGSGDVGRNKPVHEQVSVAENVGGGRFRQTATRPSMAGYSARNVGIKLERYAYELE